MAKIENGSGPSELAAELRKMPDEGLIAQCFVQQGAVHAVSWLMANGCNEKRAAEMLESERVKMRVRILEEQLHMAQEQYEDMKSQRDSWQKQAQQILLTSQYSQKQAEELKAELKEREARDVARRAALEERMKKLKEQSNNQNKKPEAQNTESPFAGLWDMVKTKFVKKSA